jgi:transposase-like protein
MKCPKCGSEFHCKDGIVKGRQRFKCKHCNYRYTVEKKSNVKSKEIKRLAFEMYLEGLGFRSIGRILKISYVTVFQWIKKWGKNLELPIRNESISVVELDEMHTYVSQKKTTDGYGLLLIDMEKGFSLLSVATAPHKPV